MILGRLTTQNFRNLEPGEHAFHPAANILVGRNGQGKTNLLEAIYFLATTKSFRTAKVTSLFRFGSANVFVSGVLVTVLSHLHEHLGQSIAYARMNGVAPPWSR